MHPFQEIQRNHWSHSASQGVQNEPGPLASEVCKDCPWSAQKCRSKCRVQELGHGEPLCLSRPGECCSAGPPPNIPCTWSNWAIHELPCTCRVDPPGERGDGGEARRGGEGEEIYQEAACHAPIEGRRQSVAGELQLWRLL